MKLSRFPAEGQARSVPHYECYVHCFVTPPRKLLIWTHCIPATKCTVTKVLSQKKQINGKNIYSFVENG